MFASEDTTSFPLASQFNNSIPERIVNLGSPDSFGGPGTGGIFFVDGNGLPNPDLQRASIVAISASGNVHGTIEAGRVFRLQALGHLDPQTNQVVDGLVTANIKAIAEDVPPSGGGLIPLGNMSIGVLTAHEGFTGTIIASTRDDLPFAYGDCSIGRVTVTSPSTDSNRVGIGGDILAGGNIGAIFSTGTLQTQFGGSISIVDGGSIQQRNGRLQSGEHPLLRSGDDSCRR